jgi:hypothetical protein
MTDWRYSRAAPSPHYHALLEMYRQMHGDGYRLVVDNAERRQTGDEAFPGDQLQGYLGAVRVLVDETGARTLLDYGTGKGRQYADNLTITTGEGQVFHGIRQFLGVERIDTWEPALGQRTPPPRCDGVVCTDVLEHCFAADLPWIVDELFALAGKFVFASIACGPAAARLPNGENAHITLRPAAWWQGVFDATSSRHGDCDYLICCMTTEGVQWHRRARYETEITAATRFER